MRRVIAFVAALLACAHAARSQEGNEQPPILRASEILKPDFVSGPHFKVRESVPTQSGANRFVIDSEFGVFVANGNALLETRIAEIAAIDKLKQMSRSDEYAKALERAAKSPVTFGENLVKDPAKTVGSVGKGALKLLNRVAEGVKETATGGGGSAEDTTKSALGVETAKRQIAADLGVDPYTTNDVLRHELDGMAWASFAGGATVKALMLPLSGGVVTAAKVASTSADVQQMLRESSPGDLRRINAGKLAAMKVPKEGAESFLANASISPTHQTAMVLLLEKLEGVEGRAEFVRAAAATADDEQDAIFWDMTARMLADVHARGPKLAKIALLDVFPYTVAQDGTTVVALHWDYACWTVLAEKFAGAIRNLDASRKSACALALSGVASPRLRKELESRGFRVEDRLAPGPLR